MCSSSDLFSSVPDNSLTSDLGFAKLNLWVSVWSFLLHYHFIPSNCKGGFFSESSRVKSTGGPSKPLYGCQVTVQVCIVFMHVVSDFMARAELICSREQSSVFTQGIMMLVCVGLQSEQEKQLMRQVRKEGRKEERRQARRDRNAPADEQDIDQEAYLRAVGFDPDLMKTQRCVFLWDVWSVVITWICLISGIIILSIPVLQNPSMAQLGFWNIRSVYSVCNFLLVHLFLMSCCFSCLKIKSPFCSFSF